MSKNYPITPNLPVPKGRSEKYPWRKMKVGDSFPFKTDEYDRICYAAAMARRRHNAKYRVSKEELRVWRVE